MGDQGPSRCALTAAGSENGSLGPGDVGHLRHLGSSSRTCFWAGRVREAPVGVHDDVDGVAGLAREAVLQQGLRPAGVRPGRRVVGLELAAEGRRPDDGDAQRRHPREHGQAAAAVGEPRHPAQGADMRSPGSGLGRGLGGAAGGQDGHLVRLLRKRDDA